MEVRLKGFDHEYKKLRVVWWIPYKSKIIKTDGLHEVV
jgi:hypothetical protein